MATRGEQYGAPRGGGPSARGGGPSSRGNSRSGGSNRGGGNQSGPYPPGPGNFGPGYGAGTAYEAYGNYGYGAGYGQGPEAFGEAAPPGYGFPGYTGFPPMPIQGGPPPSPLDEEIQIVIGEIQNEIASFEQAGEWGEQFKNARRLLISESEKLENSIDPEWLEVDIQKPIKVIKKVLVPVYRYPKFNFVGKILGPKGATLQTLSKTHKCHIYVLGRGSTKDQRKENELLMTGDPQYAHYGGPLHVKIETIAPAHIAYQRVTSVLEELSKILQPIREDTTPAHLKTDGSGSGEGNNDDSNNQMPDMSMKDSMNNGMNMGGNIVGGGGPMRSNRGMSRGRVARGRGGRGIPY